jgi:hypothetical protein
VTYKKFAPNPEIGHTCDMITYLMWANLGDLKPGAYILEMYETGEQVVTLSRRVRVTAE